ncbi:MAG: SpoIIE family protein phosphatase [Acidobacteriota bacterium]
MSLRSRLLAVLIPTIVLLLGIVIFASFRKSEQTVLEQINAETYQLASSQGVQFDILFESSQKIADGVAVAIASMDPIEKSSVERLLRNTLETSPNVFGTTAAFVPGATALGRFSPYFHRTSHGVAFTSLADPAYDYPRWDWYKTPLERNGGTWGEPYFDRGGGNVLMTTYSVPIRASGTTIGVATVDISLEDLVRRIRKVTVGESGFAFVVTSDGHLIAHPTEGVLSQRTLGQMDEDSTDGSMRQLAELIRTPGPDFVEMIDPFTRRSSWVICTPLQATGWTLTVIYPSAEILRPLRQLKSNVAVVSAIILVLLVALILLVSASVASPISQLVKQAEQYSRGAFDQRLNTNEGPTEIRRLSGAFNYMGKAIADQIETVKSTAAQKERYRQELMIAAEIQQSILPRIFPPFPEFQDRLDIYGLTKPAREVAGDYYDFFRLPGDRIAIVVADVSGKGAPSSLMMAMTRMLVREIAERNYQPAEVMRRVNHMLARDNVAGMFVTVLYGEYHLNTGFTRFVCAGHNPPLHLRPGEKAAAIHMKTNLPVAVLPATHFHTTEFTLGPGEALLLYTDGVTEAMDAQGDMFGMERLMDSVGPLSERPCVEIAEGLLSVVEKFSPHGGRDDDITIVTLRRRKEEEHMRVVQVAECHGGIRMELPARTGMLGKICSLAEAVGRDIGFSEGELYQISLALDEVATNVIMHAYGGDTNETFQVEFHPRADGLCVTVTDYGMPFDFEAKLNRYDGHATIDQPIGGIGLFLTRKSVDGIWYEPETFEGNKVTFVKYLQKQPVPP